MSKGFRRALSVLVASAMLLATVLVTAAPVAAGDRGNSANAKLCQKSGWTMVYRADGTRFADQDACTSFGATGGTYSPWNVFQQECSTLGAQVGQVYRADFGIDYQCWYAPDTFAVYVALYLACQTTAAGGDWYFGWGASGRPGYQDADCAIYK